MKQKRYTDALIESSEVMMHGSPNQCVNIGVFFGCYAPYKHISLAYR